MTEGLVREEIDLTSWVDTERSQLDSHYDTIANVVGLGTNSGELRLRIDHHLEDSPASRECVDGLKVESVTITRAEVPNPPEDASSSVTYHAVITGFTKKETGETEPFHTSEAFLHQMAAMTWVEEYVPDFDLYPVLLYDGDDTIEERYAEVNNRRSLNSFWE